jgi:hypothetical protein
VRAGLVIDNRTELPDQVVREAVHGALGRDRRAPVRHAEQLPALRDERRGQHALALALPHADSNVIDEIKLARQVVDTDDDIAAVIGQSIATAFGDGMENLHEDEKTIALFNKICGPISAGGMNMDMLLKEMYREYLIAASFTTLSLFTRSRYNFKPGGGGQSIQAQLATPLVGVLPAENIRVLANDIFGNAPLAYNPTTSGCASGWRSSSVRGRPPRGRTRCATRSRSLPPSSLDV